MEQITVGEEKLFSIFPSMVSMKVFMASFLLSLLSNCLNTEEENKFLILGSICFNSTNSSIFLN